LPSPPYRFRLITICTLAALCLQLTLAAPQNSVTGGKAGRIFIKPGLRLYDVTDADILKLVGKESDARMFAECWKQTKTCPDEGTKFIIRE